LTVAELTPSSFPDAEVAEPSGTGSIRFRYAEVDVDRYLVRLPTPAPRALRLSVEFGQEDVGVWAHIDELDVSAEGENLAAAFRNLVGATQAWLSYIRDESPDMAPELAGQERYVALLDAPVFSWFKGFRFAE
jgi:hypothetical protein